MTNNPVLSAEVILLLANRFASSSRGPTGRSWRRRGSTDWRPWSGMTPTPSTSTCPTLPPPTTWRTRGAWLASQCRSSLDSCRWQVSTNFLAATNARNQSNNYSDLSISLFLCLSVSSPLSHFLHLCLSCLSLSLSFSIALHSPFLSLPLFNV